VIRASSPLAAGDVRASVIDRCVGNMSVVEARADERGALGALKALVLFCFLGWLFFSSRLYCPEVDMSVARKGGYIRFIESSCSEVIEFSIV